ncbi:MAG: hypothetical protein AAFY13_10905, partial [Pseudomonadota bacterium]
PHQSSRKINKTSYHRGTEKKARGAQTRAGPYPQYAAAIFMVYHIMPTKCRSLVMIGLTKREIQERAL